MNNYGPGLVREQRWEIDLQPVFSGRVGCICLRQSADIGLWPGKYLLVCLTVVVRFQQSQDIRLAVIIPGIHLREGQHTVDAPSLERAGRDVHLCQHILSVNPVVPFC